MAGHLRAGRLRVLLLDRLQRRSRRRLLPGADRCFAHGQTAFRMPPPPELLALPDPYDPAQNPPYRLHDASLYEGRWYLYFGPSPVVLYLPLRVIGVEVLDQFAVALFCSLGFLVALALLRFLVQRYRPQTSLATRAVAVVLLGFANVAPFLLRRPAVYEVAISAGFASCSRALPHADRRAPSRGPVSGASGQEASPSGLRRGRVRTSCSPPRRRLGLVPGPPRSRRPWGGRARLLRVAASSVPLGTCLFLLGLYNVVRFGSADRVRPDVPARRRQDEHPRPLRPRAARPRDLLLPSLAPRAWTSCSPSRTSHRTTRAR